MNIERLNQAIAVMRRAGTLDMTNWQEETFTECATTEETLHTCGNSACFAGWVAVSPEFQEAGGEVHPDYGFPIFGKLSGASAVCEWLEADEYEWDVIYLLVTGEAHILNSSIDTLIQHGISVETPDRKDEGRSYACLFNWANFKAPDVIKILEVLRDE